MLKKFINISLMFSLILFSSIIALTPKSVNATTGPIIDGFTINPDDGVSTNTTPQIWMHATDPTVDLSTCEYRYRSTADSWTSWLPTAYYPDVDTPGNPIFGSGVCIADVDTSILTAMNVEAEMRIGNTSGIFATTSPSISRTISTATPVVTVDSVTTDNNPLPTVTGTIGDPNSFIWGDIHSADNSIYSYLTGTNNGDGTWSATVTDALPVGTYILDITADNLINYGYASSTYTVTDVVLPPPTIYTITASSDANGMITPMGAVSVSSGTDQTFTITPNAGYMVLDVLVDGTSVGAVPSYTFTGVTANHTIDASFSAIPPTMVTINSTAGVGGTINPLGLTSVVSGANQSFTITPDSGYDILDVLVDGNSVGPVPAYGFTNVTTSHTIDATFVLIPVLTTIGVNPNSPSITAGNTQQFTATTLDQNNNPISVIIDWSSSDTAVATIDPFTGLATSITAGQTTITATSGSVTGTALLTVTINTVVDTTAPVITMLGTTPVTIEVGSTYVDAGATALDNLDGNITANILTTNNVNTALIGSYTVTYNVSDSHGNVATPVVRTVNVIAKKVVHHSSGGSGGSSQVTTDQNENTTPSQIIGCGERTTGFSTVSGKSCGTNISHEEGQVLGAEKFIFTLNLRLGAHNNEVIELQKFLTSKGYVLGNADGRFGPKTKASLIKFQIKNGLKGDGTVGPMTRAVLNK